ASDIDDEARFAGVIFDDLEPNVVGLYGGSVVRRAGYRDLELPRQIREFRVEGRPLPDDLAPDAGIFDFIGSGPRKLVGRGVADAISRSLDRVHLHFGQFAEDRGHVLQRGPIELDVLTGGEMPVAFVVDARDMRQAFELARIERTVRNSDTQHV